MKRVLVFVLMILGLAMIASAVMPSNAAASVISGTVYWYDQYGNLHPFPWVQVTATSTDGDVITTYSTDGTYRLYVASGTYDVIASSGPAFISQNKTVTVSPGGIAAGVDFQLKPSGNPVPEYPSIAQPVLLLMATLAAAVLVRRRSQAHSQAD